MEDKLMRAAIKSFFWVDVEPSEENSRGLPRSSVIASLEVGPAEGRGAEIFYATFCTPHWLAATLPDEDIVSGRHQYFVESLDLPRLRSFLHTTVNELRGPDWSSLADQLARTMSWEFEDYSDLPPMARQKVGVFAVARWDSIGPTPERSFAVKEVVPTVAEAESEVARLNDALDPSATRYFWQATSFFPDGRQTRDMRTPLLKSSRGADPLELPVEYGSGIHPLHRMIDWWAYEVLRYREIALGVDTKFPPPRWAPHDFVGALHLREAIDRALRPGDGHNKLVEPPSLKSVDALHIESTGSDDRRLLSYLEIGYDDLISDPLRWWWRRFPASGAVLDETLDMLDIDQ